MSDATTTVEAPVTTVPTEATPAKPKAALKPKKPTKASLATAANGKADIASPKPKPKGKAKGKPAPKEPKAPRAKKEGLRKPQVRILETLSEPRNKAGLTRAEIAEKAEVDSAFCTTWIGSLNDEGRIANALKRGIPSLLCLKAVKPSVVEDRGTVFTITAAGLALLKKAQAEATE